GEEGRSRMSSSVRQSAESRDVTYVDSAARLRAVCEHLAGVERFALDTEFVGERTYVPALELIQVATPSQMALIDCRAVAALDPFFTILADQRIEKVRHAGQQDLELFQRLTDWSRRPLTKAQLAYAVDDVRYLLPVYEKLRARLTQQQRWEWLVEECKRLERSVRSLPVEPAEAWLRVRGRGTLRAKGLAVLRELAAWREEQARERNKPRATIARDEVLVEIARKAPTNLEALRGLR